MTKDEALKMALEALEDVQASLLRHLETLL